MDLRTINRLTSIIDGKRNKYTYNLARYLDDITVSLNDTLDYVYSSAGYSFARPQDSDLSRPGSFSVVRSCIDSLVSKISANKVRPYIHPVNGTFKSKQITRQVRQFFDVALDYIKVPEKIIDAFRIACIFDTGYLFINPFTYKIQTLLPFTVGLFNMEAAYGDNKEMVVKMNNYPVSLLDKKYKNNIGMDYCQFVITVSTIDHRAEMYINGVKVDETAYKAGRLPYVALYYSKPTFGTRTYSLADALEGIQEQIDLISSKIAASAEMTAGNTTYVVEGSSLNAQDVNNRTGNVYTVKMPEGSSNIPVLNVTPAPFDPSWTQLLDSYIDRAYEITGISQLSAQSKKPAGLDSGVGLATLEDIESERFQTQLDNYINAYKDLAKLMIEVFPDDASILPEDIYSTSYRWKDIKASMALMRINFAADDALAKDPAQKLQQISQISQIGAIDINELLQQLDSTDLENAYKDSASKINAIEKCIENAIEKGDYAVPSFVSYEDLYTRVLNTENMLYSSLGDDDKSNKEIRISLLRVQTLEQILLKIIDKEGMIKQNKIAEPMTAEETGLTGTGATNQFNVADTINAQGETDEPIEGIEGGQEAGQGAGITQGGPGQDKQGQPEL